MFVYPLLISLLSFSAPEIEHPICLPADQETSANLFCCTGTDGLQCCAQTLDFDTGKPQSCACS